MSLFLVTPPSIEPLTIAEAKAQCRMGSASGEPAPSAPAAALISPAAAGNIENGAHRYGVTFVTADGETELGTVTAAVTVTDKTVNGKISLSAIPTGGSAVTSRKIYRTVAGGSTYLLLATLADNTTTVYTDNIADASLGAQAPTTNSTSNPELVRWIISAREFVETYTGRKLLTQTLALKLNGFPCGDIVLPFSPVSSVTSVTYLDTDGVSQTWTAGSTGYTTDLPTGPWAAPARVRPAYQVTYPQTRDDINAVTVTFVAGYGAAVSAVPAGIKSAMLMLISHWDRNREAVNVGNIVNVLPFGIDALLWPFKLFPNATS